MNKIKCSSHILYLFFRALCWVIPLATIYLILFNLAGLLEWGSMALIIPSVHVNNGSDFSLIHRLVILSIQLLPLSVTVLICKRLAKLFQLYEQGQLFEMDNIKLIKNISILMIIGQIVQIIYQPLITVALTFNNPVGERIASISLGTTNASTLITAFILLVASWIIKEAHLLKSDSQLTI